MSGAAGDYHGQFVRWDPFTCKTLANMHLQRQYTAMDKGAEAWLQQKNWMYFPDEQVVARGPWDITRACATSKGIRHPRVDVDGFTFIHASNENCPTAWIAHKLTNTNAVE